MRGIISASAILLLGIVRFNDAAIVQGKDTNDHNAVYGHHNLLERQTSDNEPDITVCPLNQTGVSYLADIYNHFGYIAFDGKELFSYEYDRPMAIYGDLSIDTFNGISPDHPLTCTNTSDIYSYGFVASGGTINYGEEVKVYGNSFVDDPSVAKIAPQGDGCQIYPTSESIFDFPLVYAGLMKASKYLSSLKPDLHLTAEGHITSLGDPENPAYRVITLNTCDPPASGDSTCSSLPQSQLSDPKGILFFGVDYVDPHAKTWPGPDNPALYADAPTVVINVPVPNGSVMTIETGIPNTGFDACRLIFNFYPVDGNGVYYDGDDSTFTIKNGVPSSWEAFILGPRGTLDSTSTPTGGKLFFNVLLDDYKSHLLDFQCGVWGGCFPVEDISQTTTEYSTSTVHSVTVAEEYTTLYVTQSKPTTLVTTITTASTTVITVPTTEIVRTTASVYVPVEDILEIEEEKKVHDKEEKWSGGKGGKWTGKEGKWSEEKEGKWSEEKDGKWSGKDDKW
ncbi:hypothetical protein BJV82DRAFT_655419 [Fennellomyces sp. T-0311]|nr:hypothetical protein BJV82DRAFT_655419 [Fennellomyces sp. T-0311]